VTEIHQAIQQKIHPRITQALASLDEVMVSQAIEMDEDTHQTFLQAYQRAKTLQQGVSYLSTEGTS